jgi:hypothetical protein
MSEPVELSVWSNTTKPPTVSPTVCWVDRDPLIKLAEILNPLVPEVPELPLEPEVPEDPASPDVPEDPDSPLVPEEPLAPIIVSLRTLNDPVSPALFITR